jgi:hypothetical protein
LLNAVRVPDTNHVIAWTRSELVKTEIPAHVPSANRCPVSLWCVPPRDAVSLLNSTTRQSEAGPRGRFLFGAQLSSPTSSRSASADELRHTRTRTGRR